MTRWRVAAVGFANAQPLVAALATDPDIELALGTPAWCAAALRAGAVDVALVPTVEVLTDARLWWVGTGVIAARGAAMSTVLVANGPLDRLVAVRLSSASRSTNALAQLVLGRRLGRSIDLLAPGAPAPDADPARVGEIVIGDAAFRAAANAAFAWDLAQIWRELYGVPFVFACFAARARPPIDLVERLERARAWGLAHTGEIAARMARQLGLPLATARAYFESALHYELDAADRVGVEQFARLLGAAPPWRDATIPPADELPAGSTPYGARR